MAGGVLAAVLGPNIVSWTHDSIKGVEFAGSYIVIGLLYVLSFVIISFVKIPAFKAEQHHGKARPIAQIVRQPVYLVAVITGMLGYSVMSLVMTATPLSMSHHHSLSDTAFVIQWHVLGMFAPSFFTGKLIYRFGLLNIMLAGVVLLAMAVMGNLLGASLWHYWFALLCLGIGWNFLFIGATDLLTYTYSEPEKAKAQAVNDFSVFTAVTLSALTAGYLQHHFGWQIVNLGVVPMIIVILIALIWIKTRSEAPIQCKRKQPASEDLV